MDGDKDPSLTNGSDNGQGSSGLNESSNTNSDPSNSSFHIDGGEFEPKRRFFNKTFLSAFVALVVVAGCAWTGYHLTRGSSAAPRSHPQVSTYSFGPSAFGGGGFQNVIALSSKGVLLSGGDVSGINRSTDGGQTFGVKDAGLTNFKIASVAFDPTDPSKAYAAAGDKGKGGGFYGSPDGGQTWALLSKDPQFAGNHNSAGLPIPDNHPRSTGNLIAIDPADTSTMWTATYDQGVMRTTNSGTKWTSLGLSGKYLRSIAVDPAHPNVVYAASYTDGVWKTTTATGKGTFTNLDALPSKGHAEELAVVGGHLYVAAGDAGMLEYNGSGWTQLNTGLPNDYFLSLAGQVSGSKTVLYAGTMAPGNVYKSVDGGAHWALVSGSAHVTPNVIEANGSTNTSWWYSEAYSGALLGNNAGVMADIVISPSDVNTVYVSGSGGIWRTTDAGSHWYAAVNGMGVTANSNIATDPTQNNVAFLANTDFAFVDLTTCSGQPCAWRNRPPAADTKGFDIATDPSTTPATVYFANGNRDANKNGDIFVNSDPLHDRGSKWTSTGLKSKTSGARPLGVAVKQVGGHTVLLAAVQGKGIWKKVGSGAWQSANSTAVPSSEAAPEHAYFAWSSSSPQVVFLYDRATGLWRSTDAGTNWSKIWSKTSNDSQLNTGYLALGSDGTTLYVSTKDGVYKLPNATASGKTVGNGITATNIMPSSMNRPGPLTVDKDGNLWVTGVTSAQRGVLTVSTDGSSFNTVSDAYYQGAAVEPCGISVTPNGTVYIATFHEGVVVGTSS